MVLSIYRATKSDCALKTPIHCTTLDIVEEVESDAELIEGDEEEMFGNQSDPPIDHDCESRYMSKHWVGVQQIKTR